MSNSEWLYLTNLNNMCQQALFILFQLHNEFNRILMNLIVAELINCSYGISLDITAAMQYGWKLGSTVCNTTGFLLTLCGNRLLLTILLFNLINFDIKIYVYIFVFLYYFRNGLHIYISCTCHSEVNKDSDNILTI